MASRGFLGIAAATVEVNGIDQNTAVVAIGWRHEPQALGEVLANGPRHRFEVDANAIQTREIAKCCEVFS